MAQHLSHPAPVWARNRIDRIRAFVEEVRPSTRSLLLHDGREIAFDRLVIATGSSPNKFGWPGQDLQGVQGLYSLQDLELLEIQGIFNRLSSFRRSHTLKS